jgi:hypothetical protein
MYEGWTRLLIVYLTHPGVLLPIPGKGLWSWARGLWQASWVMVLHSFSDGSRAFLASLVYWVFFGLSIFIPVAGDMKIDWSWLTQTRTV